MKTAAELLEGALKGLTKNNGGLNVDELRRVCEDKGLARWGKREQVVARLKEAKKEDKKKSDKKPDTKSELAIKKVMAAIVAAKRAETTEAKKGMRGYPPERFEGHSYIVDNVAGTQFMVSIRNKGVSIYKLPDRDEDEDSDYEEDWDSNGPYKQHYTQLIKAYKKVKRVFIGIGLDYEGWTDGYGPEVYGNTILIEIEPKKYCQINFDVREFTTKDTIMAYESPIGNGVAPNPIAYGTEHVYELGWKYRYASYGHLQKNVLKIHSFPAHSHGITTADIYIEHTDNTTKDLFTRNIMALNIIQQQEQMPDWKRPPPTTAASRAAALINGY